MIKLAINGYGRIGRSVLRALNEGDHREALQVVAVNELADANTVLHLTRYDSTHGRFAGQVTATEGGMRVDDQSIRLLSRQAIDGLPWRELEVDVVLECSGSFDDRATANKHIEQGAGAVIFSQPAQADVDATIVYGVNHTLLSPAHRIISNASCTTNGIVPVIQALHDAFGIESGTITTIHSAMNDQPVLDAYHHTDLRKTRAAGQSIIPVDTALARGIERILPQLGGRFSSPRRPPAASPLRRGRVAAGQRTAIAAEYRAPARSGRPRRPIP